MNLNKKGAVLPYVMILMAMFTLLAVALLQASHYSGRSMQFYRRNLQAYDLAWSGAAAVADYISDRPDDVDSLDGLTSDPYAIGKGSFQVALSQNADGSEVYLDSTGTVGDKEAQLRLVMEPSGTAWVKFGILSKNTIDFSNSSSVIGDIASNTEGTATPYINVASPQAILDGDAFLYGYGSSETNGFVSSSSTEVKQWSQENPLEFPVPDASAAPSAFSVPEGIATITTPGTATLAEDTYCQGDFTLSSSQIITVDSPLPSIHLYFDTLVLNQGCGIEVASTTDVFIHIGDDLYLHGSKANPAFIGSSTDNSEIAIYYFGSNSGTLVENKQLDIEYGNVYASLYIIDNFTGDAYIPELRIRYGSVFYGDIISLSDGTISAEQKTATTEEMNSSLNGLIWAPYSIVTLQQSSSMSGAVIADTVHLENSAALAYDPSVFDNDGFLSRDGRITYIVKRWE